MERSFVAGLNEVKSERSASLNADPGFRCAQPGLLGSGTLVHP
jgi:hypothetical protein